MSCVINGVHFRSRSWSYMTMSAISTRAEYPAKLGRWPKETGTGIKQEQTTATNLWNEQKCNKYTMKQVKIWIPYHFQTAWSTPESGMRMQQRHLVMSLPITLIYSPPRMCERRSDEMELHMASNNHAGIPIYATEGGLFYCCTGWDNNYETILSWHKCGI